MSDDKDETIITLDFKPLREVFLHKTRYNVVSKMLNKAILSLLPVTFIDICDLEVDMKIVSRRNLPLWYVKKYIKKIDWNLYFCCPSLKPWDSIMSDKKIMKRAEIVLDDLLCEKKVIPNKLLFLFEKKIENWNKLATYQQLDERLIIKYAARKLSMKTIANHQVITYNVFINFKNSLPWIDVLQRGRIDPLIVPDVYMYFREMNCTKVFWENYKCTYKFIEKYHDIIDKKYEDIKLIDKKISSNVITIFNHQPDLQDEFVLEYFHIYIKCKPIYKLKNKNRSFFVFRGKIRYVESLC